MEKPEDADLSSRRKPKINLLFKHVILVFCLMALGGVILPAFVINIASALQPNSGETAAEQGPDLALELSHSGEFAIGDNGGAYTITVTNVGSSVVTGTVTISDSLPAGIRLNHFDSNNNWDCSASDNRSLFCTADNANSINMGEALLPVNFWVDVDESAAPTVTNSASLANVNDVNPQNNNASIKTTITSADLEISQSVSNPTPKQGAVVTYTVRVQNNGPSHASGVEIKIRLPDELSYIEHQSTKGKYSPADGEWKIASLENQKQALLNIRTQVVLTQAGARILGSAGEVSADQHDWDINNDNNSIELQAQNEADLDVDLDHNSPSNNLYEGQNITFITRITNEGEVTAQSVVVTDTLGTDYDYLSSTNSESLQSSTLPDGYTRFWEPFNLRPGDVFTLNLNARVKTNIVNPVSLTNLVTATTTTAESNLDNNTAEIKNLTTPVIEISYTVNPTDVRLNQSMNFVIEVENSGTGPAENVRVETQTFPTELTISNLSANISGVNITTSGGRVVATVGTLAARQLLVINFRGTLSTVPSTTRTEQNLCTVTWQVQGIQDSLVSSTISYRLISTTLPGTGGMERDQPVPAGLTLAALVFAFILGISGFAAILFSLVSRSSNPTWAPWFSGVGLLLVGACMVFGLAALVLGVDFNSIRLPTFLANDKQTGALVQFQEPWVPKSTPQAPEVLPDFPIPAPEISQVQQESREEPPDVSPPFRLLIPNLGIDADVKYVPFEDYTWLIAGLRQEIAWMGDTSWPGLGGNTGLAGHVTLRDGSDGPFRNLNSLNQGDEVELHTDENIYTYRVREQVIVDDEDMVPVEKTDNTQLSLITCTGWNKDLHSYEQRLIVIADLVKVEQQHQQISQVDRR